MSEESKFDAPATPSRLTTPRVTLHGSFFASPEPVSEPAGGAGREDVHGAGSGTSALATPDLDTIPVGSQVLVFSAYAGVVLRAGPKSCVVHLRRDAAGVERTVPCRYVKPFTAEEEAAALVQTIARGMLDRNRFRMKMSWEVYNTLDNDLEHLHLERSRKLESARALGQAKAREADSADDSVPTMDTPRSHSLGADARKFEALKVEASYTGPHLRWPLTDAQVFELMDAFKAGKQLHFKYVMQIFAEFRAVARRTEETVTKITIPKGAKLTVCGDVHGHLKDVLHIFSYNGPPSPKNIYLWNGDFVDRGSQGIEIVMILFAFKILYPEFCILQRGNHEDRSQNEYYNRAEHGCWGFLEEVNHKYGSRGVYARKVYSAAHHCFELLPIATVVNDTVLVIHGGLFRGSGVTLRHLQGIRRKRPIPLCRGRATFEDSIFEDLMWSDPMDADGYAQSTRNAGVMFGPDVTNQFLAANKLRLIVRSHECVDEGLQWQKGNKLVTVFSASFYNGYPNKGAILTFTDTLKLSSYQYAVVDAAHASLTDLQRVAMQEQHSLEIIRERILASKAALYWFFTNADDGKTGHVTPQTWAEGMKAVLALPSIPWLLLRTNLCDLDPDTGLVNYSRFLARYHVTMPGSADWLNTITREISLRLFQACADIKAAYELFDINKDGKIEFEEFHSTLSDLNLGLTDPQLYELMRSIDVDVNATIDFDEFRKRFHVDFLAAKAAANVGPVAASAGRAGGGKSSRGSGSGSGSGGGGGGGGDGAGAGARDGDGDGTSVSGETAESDAAGAGTGSGASMSTVDTGDGTAVVVLDDWTQAALQTIGKRMLQSMEESHKVFEAMDSNGDHLVDPGEFIECMKRLGLDGYSEDDCLRIFSAIDVDGSGRIDYDEFLAAFQVRLGDEAESAPDGWQHAVIEQIVAVLYTYRVELKAAFSMFDLDNSGKINCSEFRAGLQALAQHLDSPLTNPQIDALMAYLDSDGDGLLSYTEFFAGFQVQDLGESAESTTSS